MVEFFVNKILSSNLNEFTIDDVPELWREQVKLELEKIKTKEGSESYELYTGVFESSITDNATALF